MLTTRTKRAAAAAFLGVFGLFVAGAASAQPYYYAAESFSSANAVTVGDKTFYTMAFRPSSDLGEVVRVPQAILEGLAYYARVEFVNLRLNGGSMELQMAQPTSSGGCNTNFATSGGANSPVSAGGAGGAIAFSSVQGSGTALVYSLNAGVDAPANSCLKLRLGSTAPGLQGTGGNVQYNVKLYDGLAGAIRALDSSLLGSTTTGGIAKVESVVTAGVTAASSAFTASVERGFAAFTGTSPNSAVLANVRLLTTHERAGTKTGPTAPGADKYRSAATGMDLANAAAATALVGTGSKVYVKSDRGDFSVGAYTLAGGTGCPAKGALTKVTTGDRAGQLMGALGRTGAETVSVTTTTKTPASDSTHAYRRTGAGTGCALTLNVKANADLEAANPPGDFKAIKAQKFTMDVMVSLAGSVPATIANRLNLSNQAAGEIKRDGTTVHLPFLTTRPGYEHKLLLVNRGTKDADFWIEGVSAANGTGATSLVSAASPMTVSAMDQKTVLASALVNFGEGNSDGAATLSINSPRDNVSVSSILTNLASQSTDTLSLVNPVVAADVRVPVTPTAPGSVGTGPSGIPTPPPGTGGGGGGTPAPPPTSGQSNCGKLIPAAGRDPARTEQRGSYSCTASDCCDVNQTAGGGRCDDASRPACP